MAGKPTDVTIAHSFGKAFSQYALSTCYVPGCICEQDQVPGTGGGGGDIPKNCRGSEGARARPPRPPLHATAPTNRRGGCAPSAGCSASPTVSPRAQTGQGGAGPPVTLPVPGPPAPRRRARLHALGPPRRPGSGPGVPARRARPRAPASAAAARPGQACWQPGPRAPRRPRPSPVEGELLPAAAVAVAALPGRARLRHLQTPGPAAPNKDGGGEPAGRGQASGRGGASGARPACGPGRGQRAGRGLRGKAGPAGGAGPDTGRGRRKVEAGLPPLCCRVTSSRAPCDPHRPSQVGSGVPRQGVVPEKAPARHPKSAAGASSTRSRKPEALTALL